MLFDFAIIGGGIVGISTARSLLLSRPESKIAIFEKEDDLAKHQAGRNIGVIHAGVHYQPGSLKATFCKEGAEVALRFRDERDMPDRQQTCRASGISSLDCPVVARPPGLSGREIRLEN